MLAVGDFSLIISDALLYGVSKLGGDVEMRLSSINFDFDHCIGEDILCEFQAGRSEIQKIAP